MKKTYKIDVDCANCANLMEQAAKKTAGVKDASYAAELQSQINTAYAVAAAKVN